MSATSNAAPASPALLRPVGWVGRTVLTATSYVGGAVLLSLGAVGWLLRPDNDSAHGMPGFALTTARQVSWMLAYGFPLVGLVHMAMGSFLAMQAYYGSTFIDGTGAVVGVGLLRNLGGMMSGMILAALLAARMIPELRRLSSLLTVDDAQSPLPAAVRLAAPRIAAAAIACPLLSLWGVAVGTLIGWQASVSMMGLPSKTFFLMLVKMMWYRDVVGLVLKGLLFGLFPAAICCHEALRRGFREPHPGRDRAAMLADAGAPLSTPVFRATCLGIVSILIVSMSWFMLVYHAVPFYGPTLLKPPSP
jgi:phospholipid/cholesterol/gamma-HCH transport system permease protein